MSKLRGMKQKLAAISRLWESGKYDHALQEVDSLLESFPGNARLHIMKASLIQLQEEPKYELEDAKQALHQAIELDRESPSAFIELGHFLDNVEDDPQAAIKAFADGAAAARQLLVTSLLGQARAYKQLDKRQDFLRCLMEVLQLVQAKGPYADEVDEILSEVEAERSALSASRRNGS